MTRLKNWWKRQTTNNQIWLGTAGAAVVLGLWLQNASWFLGWQFINAYGVLGVRTLDISQTQHLCNTYSGNFPNTLTASDCNSANNWTTILTLLFWAGVVTLGVTLFRIRRSKSKPPPVPSMGPHPNDPDWNSPEDSVYDSTHGRHGASAVDTVVDHDQHPSYTSHPYPRHGRRREGMISP
jgi:hypothetical protein